MMNDLLKALPDGNPITSICIVDEPTNCPGGYQLISRTYDQDTDADLWKDGIFRSKVTRYLCISKSVRQAEECVMESLMIINEKDAPPANYSVIRSTKDNDQPALKKKQLCYKLSFQKSLVEAITDLIVMSKNAKNPPSEFLNAGEINGLSIYYKMSPINSSANKNDSPAMPNNNLPYQMPQGPHSYSTWGPGYKQSSTESYQNKSSNSNNVYRTAIDGVPFEINSKYNVNDIQNFILPQIGIKTASQLDSEYNYDFKLEYQTQERIPSSLE